MEPDNQHTYDPRAEEAALAFINSAQTPEALVRRFRDEETGEEAIDTVSARAILYRRDRDLTAPGFKSLAEVIEAGDLDTETFRLSVDRFFGMRANTDCPVLLFPVRLETRIFRDRTLRVRIYPDQLMIESHQSELTNNEIRAGKEFHEQTDREGAWRSLSQRYGPARAAWVVRETRENSNADGTPGGVKPGWHQAPTLRTLPDRFAVFVYRKATDEEPAYVEPGNDITKELTIPSPANKAKGRMDDDSRWFFHFDAALSDGMAVEIGLKPEDIERIEACKKAQEPLFERIIAVGLKKTNAYEGQKRLVDFFTNHRYTGGLAFVEPATPTTNTASTGASPAPHEADGAASYQTEALETLAAPPTGLDRYRPLHRTNADRLGLALGLADGASSMLRYLAGADNCRAAYAWDIQTLLWPATGDYMLREMLEIQSGCFEGLSRATLVRIAEHARNYVKAAGPLPTLRFGKLPYGILPVASWRNWTHQDPERVTPQSLLGALAEEWMDPVRDPELVPRVGGIKDTDQELLRILGMSAVSSEYFLRLFIDVAFYQPFDFDWAAIVESARAQVHSLLAPQEGDEPPCIAGLPLFNALACGAKPLPDPLVAPNGKDLLHLSSLCDGTDGATGDEANTLLAQLGARSIERVVPWRDKGELKAAVDHLAGPFRERAQPSDMTIDQWRSIRRDFTHSVASFESAPASGFPQVRTQMNRLRAMGERQGAASIDRATWIQYQEDLERLVDSHHRLVLRHRPSSEPAAEHREVVMSRKAITGHLDTWEHHIVEGLTQPATVEPLEKPDIDRLFRETLDVCTHRLDAWITSLATQRLDRMRDAQPDGIHLGAYGWVENLSPGGPVSSGYIHSFSAKYGAMAAVLYSAFLSQQQRHENAGETGFNSYRINLNSIRVQKAMRLLSGIRDGQELGALLGYHFERALHESHESLDQYIDDFRNAFPLVANRMPETPPDDEEATKVAARNVVDGLMLLWQWLELRTTNGTIDLNDLHAKLSKLPTDSGSPEYQKLYRILETLVELRDAASDLLLSEAIYQTTRGNHERAGAALEAMSGSLRAPEIESVKTPVSGSRLSHRVCLLLPEAEDSTTESCTPRGRAEPRLEAWFSRLLGDMSGIKCRVTYDRVVASGATVSRTRTVTLADLEIGALDFFYMAHAQPGDKTQKTELEQRIAFFVRQQDPRAVYDGNPLHFDFSRTDGINRTMAEALYLADVLHDMIGDGALLRPGSLADPSQAYDADYEQGDVDVLLRRVEEARVDVDWLAAVLDLEEGVSIECRRPVIVAALHLASQFGISGAIPAGPADPDLAILCKAVQTDLANRAEGCRRVLDGIQPPATADEEGAPGLKLEVTMGKLTRAMKALFGDSFIVLPEFSRIDRQRLGQVWNEAQTLQGVDQNRIRLWLQQAAQVQTPLARVEDALLTAEAWQGVDGALSDDGPMQFQLAQFLPGDGDAQPWLALADSERGDAGRRPEHALSLLALAPSEFTGAVPGRVAGLLLDQWDELIPYKSIRSNITFHYDRPGAQAPNCLLLAVPREGVGSRTAEWDLDVLRDVVIDTLELSKVRAVDLDALPDVGGMLPGLFFELVEPED